MKKKLITLNDSNLDTLETLKEEYGINSDAEMIRLALTLTYRNLESENARVTMYKKKPSGNKSKKKVSEDLNTEGIKLCKTFFEGDIVDSYGNSSQNGTHCKYDTYNRVTGKLVMKAKGVTNPLNRLSGLQDTKYQNTSKEDMRKFEENGGTFEIIE